MPKKYDFQKKAIVPDNAPDDSGATPMPMQDNTADPAEEQGEDITIKILSGGGYVLSSQGEDYGYESKDLLLKAVSDELDSKGSDVGSNDMMDKKGQVAKMIGGDQNAA